MGVMVEEEGQDLQLQFFLNLNVTDLQSREATRCETTNLWARLPWSERACIGHSARGRVGQAFVVV